MESTPPSTGFFRTNRTNPTGPWKTRRTRPRRPGRSNSMELLERYLQAVGKHLPAQNRADTLAELRANLLAEIEEREESAGRPLTDAEAASVLEAHGMPVIVASRYLPQ